MKVPDRWSTHVVDCHLGLHGELAEGLGSIVNARFVDGSVYALYIARNGDDCHQTRQGGVFTPVSAVNNPNCPGYFVFPATFGLSLS